MELANKKITRKSVAVMLVLSLAMAMTFAVNTKAATTASDGYIVGGEYFTCSGTRTTAKATATTSFSRYVSGETTGATVNTVIKVNNGTGATSEGTPKHADSGQSVSVSYTCPSGYKIIKATSQHYARVNGATSSTKHLSF